MKSLVSAILVFGLSTSARAGDPPPVVVPHWSLGGQNGALAGVADVNHDGLPDLVAVDDSGIATRFGVGCGELGPLVANPTGTQELTGTLGDLDGDGEIDVVAVGHTGIPVSTATLQVL